MKRALAAFSSFESGGEPTRLIVILDVKVVDTADGTIHVGQCQYELPMEDDTVVPLHDDLVAHLAAARQAVIDYCDGQGYDVDNPGRVWFMNFPVKPEALL